MMKIGHKYWFIGEDGVLREGRLISEDKPGIGVCYWVDNQCMFSTVNDSFFNERDARAELAYRQNKQKGV